MAWIRPVVDHIFLVDRGGAVRDLGGRDADRLVEVRQPLERLGALGAREDVVEVLRTKPAPVVDAPPVVREGRVAASIPVVPSGAGAAARRRANVSSRT